MLDVISQYISTRYSSLQTLGTLRPASYHRSLSARFFPRICRFPDSGLVHSRRDFPRHLRFRSRIEDLEILERMTGRGNGVDPPLDTSEVFDLRGYCFG